MSPAEGASVASMRLRAGPQAKKRRALPCPRIMRRRCDLSMPSHSRPSVLLWLYDSPVLVRARSWLCKPSCRLRLSCVTSVLQFLPRSDWMLDLIKHICCSSSHTGPTRCPPWNSQ